MKRHKRMGNSAMAAAIISVVLGAAAIGLGVFLRLPPFATQRWGMIAGAAGVAAGVAAGALAKKSGAAYGVAECGIWVSLGGIIISAIMMVIASTQLFSS